MVDYGNFGHSLTFTLLWEGGLVDDPSDPGGQTKFGISKRAFPDLDIANLTQLQAAQIYHELYWMLMRGDDLPRVVAFVLFDFAVNSGVPRAIRSLQQSLGVRRDGEFGPITLAALHVSKKRPNILATEILQSRADHYVRLATDFPRHRKHIRGWSRRLIACAFEAGNVYN